MTDIHSCSYYCDKPQCIKAQRDELRERLAQPEQEPVAYAVYHRMGGGKSLHWPEQHSPDGDANAYQLAPLYTAPPQRKPLTDEQIAEALGFGEHTTATTRAILTHAARAIEAKIRRTHER
jgi:hypothetical protein